jgi:hypothetical protein
LSGGVATFTTSALATGNHTITTSYGGDGNFNSSTGALTGNPQVVNKDNSTTVVISSQNPSVFGQSVTFTATVTANAPGAGTPTGTVTFKDGAATLGSGTLNVSGVGTFSISTLGAGSHSITAVYNADANFTGSTSAAISQVVNQATTTVGLISSQNPSLFSHPVTFTATVSPQFSGTATGTVTFLDTTARTTIGTGTLDVNGMATVTTTTLVQGSHDITATYNADANFTGSTSAPLTQVVNPLPVPNIVVTSSLNPSAFRQKVTLTATVSSMSGTPTGTVTFMDGARAMGTVPLTTGVATITTSQWTIGNHQVTAVYNGDFNFGSGPSSVLVQRRSPKPH